MKTLKQKKEEENKKLVSKIWKSLKIDSAVKQYGFSNTKHAVRKWLEYHQENAKLLKERDVLEKRLKELNEKI